MIKNNEKDSYLLVTGATGQTAYYFFEYLKSQNYNKKIKCLIRKSSNPELINLEGLNIEVEICDFNDVDTLSKAMIGIKTVLHIAHITLSEKIIKAGKIAGVEWFICIHTTGIFSKFRRISKNYKNIENKILKQNKNVTILRPTLIYGSKRDKNMWRLISFIYKSRVFPIFGNGKNLFQPVNAIDLGKAYYNVILNKSKTFGKQYNLSGFDVISYLDIIKLITSILNKKVFIFNIPIGLSTLVVSLLNKIPKSIFNSPIKVEQVLRMREDKTFSNKQAKIDFNYFPKSFKEGIKDEVLEFINSQKLNPNN